jgi:hypothetical protein
MMPSQELECFGDGGLVDHMPPSPVIFGLRESDVAYRFVVDILEKNGFGNKLIPYGSRVVCDPPVLDTDIDFFFKVEESKELELDKILITWGFAEQPEVGFNSSRPSWGDSEPDRRFRAYRLGKINLVVTSSEVFADRHRTATLVCKKLNLLDKKDRVMIYQAILYGACNIAEQ